MAQLRHLDNTDDKHIYCSLNEYEYNPDMVPFIKDEISNLPGEVNGVLVRHSLTTALDIDLGYSYIGDNFVGTFNYPDFEEAIEEAERYLALLAIDSANNKRMCAMDKDTRSITFYEGGVEYVIDICCIGDYALVDLPEYPDIFRLSMFLGCLCKLHKNVIACSYTLTDELRSYVIPFSIFKLRDCCPVLKYKNLNYCIDQGEVTTDILDEYINKIPPR